MTTRFLCSISNEAVLKALFKVEDELMFTRAIQIATKPEEAAKVAKETVYGPHHTKAISKVQTSNKVSRPHAILGFVINVTRQDIIPRIALTRNLSVTIAR